MPGNKDLNKAKDAKKDEFYTTRQDIEAELCHYAEHFKDKVVYCNCDDPVTSEFWQFFVRNFKPYGLKKLIATHYEPDEKNYAYSLEICEDTNGDGRIDFLDEPTVKQLPCNGDFRSAACIELLKEADIVVTNPPFSLFREYVAQLMEYGKKFIIIGHQNAIKYKEIFPLIRDGKMWIGYRMNQRLNGNNMMFKVPENYPSKGTEIFIDEAGTRYISVAGTGWFTNLDITVRHEFIDLRGNYYKPSLYPKYLNYDAIEVSKTENIPCDYEGLMGVPITFMPKYNSDQFEIVGCSNVEGLLDGVKVIGKEWIDLYRSQGGKGHITQNMKSLVGITKEGRAVSYYTRIIIRNKNPEPRRYPDED